MHGGFCGAGLLLEMLGFDEQTFMPDDSSGLESAAIQRTLMR